MRARRDLLTSMVVAGNDLKTKLSTGGCLTTSEFVCTTEQRDRSREKAQEGHRSSLHYTAIVQSRPSDYVVSTLHTL